jgi:hypothetical protein
MFTAAFTTIPSFQVIFFSKNDIPIFIVIKIFGVQVIDFGSKHIAKIGFVGTRAKVRPYCFF